MQLPREWGAGGTTGQTSSWWTPSPRPSPLETGRAWKIMENSFIIKSYVFKRIISIFLSKDPWSPPESWTRWGPTSSSLPRRGPGSTTASSPSKFDLIDSPRKMNYNSSQVCGNYEIIGNNKNSKITYGSRLNFNSCLQTQSGIRNFDSILPDPRARLLRNRFSYFQWHLWFFKDSNPWFSPSNIV